MKKIIVSALAIAAMAGCSESGESGVKIGTMAAAFSSSITTRASGTEWEAGDAIGIMATSENQLLEGYRYNAKHNVDISAGTLTCSFTPEDNTHTIYYSLDDSYTLDFYGYYPYKAELSEEEQSYPISIADQSAPSAIDFMEASTRESVPEGFNASSGSVELSFTRRMAKLSFEISAGAGLSLDEITAVRLEGFSTTADYSFEGNCFTNVGGVASLAPYKSSEGLYSAIVIPTMDEGVVYTPTSHKIIFTTTSGDIEWDITSVELNAGAHRYYRVSVENTPVVSGGNEIAGWDDVLGDDLEAK